ncbi:MAG: ATP-dependent helicase [archaeon]|nr:ATP-dependent helicase [archaeon]
MISYEEFKKIVIDILERDISSNQEQDLAISSSLKQSLFIVAGPGSGKTTVMVLKILKFIFVDDVSPNEILATTFTKKAANELLSRILSWGDLIKKDIESKAWDLYFEDEDKFIEIYGVEISDFIKKIKRIDFNLIYTGTIDSVAEELLRVHRDPGTNQPVLIEEFVANSAMINVGLYKEDRYLDSNLQEYLAELKGAVERNGEIPRIKNPILMADVLLEIKNRMYYDQVKLNDLLKDVKPIERGKQLALKIIADYIDELKSKNIFDFPMLESEFLNRLEDSKLNVFLDDIKVILVDEYQDTNLLQESIYFKIAESAVKNGGNITVVGDDDQSLYRFRGATVDLFTNFSQRVKKIGISVEEVNLRTNYRSTDNIINLCNRFVELDEDYQSARVENKLKIASPNSKLSLDNNLDNNYKNLSVKKSVSNYNKKSVKDSISKSRNIPILGMFRQNEMMLARDLSKLINDLGNGKEVDLKVKRVLTKEDYKNVNLKNQDYILETRKKEIEKAKKMDSIKLRLDPDKGSPSDIAFLTYSPKEFSSSNRMFPYILKKQLSKFKNPIEVFNPRGQDFQSIEVVSIFCGLMLECIDPEMKIQKGNKKLPRLAVKNMRKWRKIAREYISNYPEPNNPISLERFVTLWQVRQPYPSNKKWPKKASLIELAYKLATWIEELQDDIEGLVYLESITKTITQNGFFNKYSANIYFDSAENEVNSIEEALWNIFVPIATGGVKLDENLFETLPPKRMNIMSIHQSKGLEFPLVIVDIGSKFSKNQSKHSKLRFPKDSDNSSILEDKIRNYSVLGESNRDSRDRSFDDLIRLYFVAFSRAQDVLLLVGLNSSIEGYASKDVYMNIPNVALGWSRDEEFKGLNEIYLI